MTCNNDSNFEEEDENVLLMRAITDAVSVSSLLSLKIVIQIVEQIFY